MSIPSSYECNHSRARHILALARAHYVLTHGRGIVDARGRLICNVHARRLVDEYGNVRETHDAPALAPHHADDMAHAVAYALTLACATQYTLAQLRNGTGFPRGARFVMVSP